MAHPPISREDAFTRVYETHYEAVRAYAYRRDPAHVDDVVAETEHGLRVDLTRRRSSRG